MERAIDDGDEITETEGGAAHRLQEQEVVRVQLVEARLDVGDDV